jgi:superkiller protein 3
MNPKLRIILIIIGLVTLLLLTIFVVPRGSSLYYQMRGGQHVEYVLRTSEGIQELACEQLPESRQADIEEVELSLADLNRAVRLNRGNSQAYYYLGKAHCLLGEPEQAVDHYQTIIELRPNNPLGYIGLGFAYEAQCTKKQKVIDVDLISTQGWRQCNDQELRDNIVAMWQTGGANAQQFLDNGIQAQSQQRYEEALIWYGRANAVQPDLVDPYFRSGLIYSDLLDWRIAAQLFEQAINLKPDDRDALYQLGLVYERVQEWEQALRAYEQALEGSGQVGLSNIYFRIGRLKEYSLSPRDYQGALIAYDEALNLDQYTIAPWQKTNTYYEKGVIFYRQSQFKEAIEQYQIALALQPNHYLAKIGLATALWKNGQAQEAENIALSAIEIDPLDKSAYNLLGNIFFEIGEFEQSEEMYLYVLELDPDDSNALEGIKALQSNQP